MTLVKSNKDITIAIERLEDLAFDQLPQELQEEILNRQLTFPTRRPTELEMWETNDDAFEHRLYNKELVVQDYMNHYKGKRKIKHV